MDTVRAGSNPAECKLLCFATADYQNENLCSIMTKVWISLHPIPHGHPSQEATQTRWRTNWGEHAIRDDHSFCLPLSFLGEDVLERIKWGGHAAIRDDHSFYLPLSFLGEDVLLSLWDGCRSQHFTTHVQTRVFNNTFSNSIWNGN
jgi:hypothetical protein